MITADQLEMDKTTAILAARRLGKTWTTMWMMFQDMLRPLAVTDEEIAAKAILAFRNRKPTHVKC